MPEDDDKDEFWGPDESDERPSRRRSKDTSSHQRKATPIVAAAAALLLIVVIFVIARSSSSDKKSNNATGTEATSGSDGTTTPGGNGTTAAQTPAAKRSQWPSVLDFPPPLFDQAGKSAADPQPGKESKPGVYLWVSFDGWHLRIVPGEGVGRITGSITGAQGTTIKAVTGADQGVARVDGTNVAFDVPPTNDVVGINFDLGFYTSTMAVTVNGDSGPLDRNLVHIGHKAQPVDANPMIFQKTKR